MLPSPCPEAAEVILSQSASLRAVHEHSRLMETEMVPLPPAASATGVVAASAGAQRADVGDVTLTSEEDPQLAQNIVSPPQNAARPGTNRRRCRPDVCDITPRDRGA